jgi:LPXTG-motif cell wall-anchored protein
MDLLLPVAALAGAVLAAGGIGWIATRRRREERRLHRKLSQRRREAAPRLWW